MRIKTISKAQGFSLFEMLTFICVLAIMVTMALPLFASTEGARQATHQKNAQTLCTLALAVQAAGYPLTEGTQDIADILKRLRDGVTVKRGPLAGRSFKVPNMTNEEITGAQAYIRLEAGELIYHRTK